MRSKEGMPREQVSEMFRLLKRYVETEMDQFELWRFDTDVSEIFVIVSMMPLEPMSEDKYNDVNHLLSDSEPD